MFDAASKKFLKTLLETSSPSGYEAEAARVFAEYTSQFADRIEQDVLGNTIAVLNESAPVRVMLAGHYDEIGFQISSISEEGLLYFRKNGGIDKLNIPSSEVNVMTAKGKIPGVIGKKPIHLLKPAERDQAVSLDDMWIDIGAESKAEAEKLVTIGDPVAMRVNFQMFGKNRIMSKGLDDKIGAFVVAETLKKLSKRKLNVAVFGAGTVQEELGLRGATGCAYRVNPAIGFAIDVGFATDIPDVSKKQLGEVTLGKGPEISRCADNNEYLVQLVREAAANHKLPYQLTASHNASGGTDTAAMQLTRGGVATCLLSIPNRYMHSAVEICDLRDAEAAASILAETIAALTGGEDFVPAHHCK